MSNQMMMEIRTVDLDDRSVVGMVAPYDETSYLVPDPAGERIVRGAFNRSIAHRGQSIPLLDHHATDRRVGMSRRWDDTTDGLVGIFGVNEGPRGDGILDELHQGYFGGMSVGFQALHVDRGDDGLRLVTEAKLVEVSLVGLPAYESAGILAVRSASDLAAVLAPFQNPPVVDLTPIAQPWRR